MRCHDGAPSPVTGSQLCIWLGSMNQTCTGKAVLYSGVDTSYRRRERDARTDDQTSLDDVTSSKRGGANGPTRNDFHPCPLYQRLRLRVLGRSVGKAESIRLTHSSS